MRMVLIDVKCLNGKEYEFMGDWVVLDVKDEESYKTDSSKWIVEDIRGNVWEGSYLICVSDIDKKMDKDGVSVKFF